MVLFVFEDSLGGSSGFIGNVRVTFCEGVCLAVRPWAVNSKVSSKEIFCHDGKCVAFEGSGKLDE